MGEIWRGGSSSNRISREKRSAKEGDYAKPSIWSGGAYADDHRRGLVTGCIIASKGGGDTSVNLWFGPEDFREIAKSMMKANPEAAEEAFKLAMGFNEREIAAEFISDRSTADANNEEHDGEFYFALVKPQGKGWRTGGGPFAKEKARKIVEEQWRRGNQARVYWTDGSDDEPNR